MAEGMNLETCDIDSPWVIQGHAFVECYRSTRISFLVKAPPEIGCHATESQDRNQDQDQIDQSGGRAEVAIHRQLGVINATTVSVPGFLVSIITQVIDRRWQSPIVNSRTVQASQVTGRHPPPLPPVNTGKHTKENAP